MFQIAVCPASGSVIDGRRFKSVLGAAHPAERVKDESRVSVKNRFREFIPTTLLSNLNGSGVLWRYRTQV
jgi:hypothetical protein